MRKKKSFNCCHCKYAASSALALRFHKYSHQNMEERAQKRYASSVRQATERIECSECDFMPLKCELKRHLETHNPTENKCNICEKTLPSQYGLRRHMNAQHRDKEFNCHICTYKARNTSLLLIHNKGVHGTKYLDCDMCDKKFRLLSNLAAHKRHVHFKCKFKCKLCEHQASTNGALKDHIASKHYNKRYACPACGYSATYKSNLERHIKSKHLGIKFSCGYCKKIFSCRSHLKRHSKEKHEEKQKLKEIVLEEPGNKAGEYVEFEESRKKPSLNETIRKGNCRICDQSFTSVDSLKNHMKYAHTEGNHNCRICYQTFALSGTLKMHMKYAHIRTKVNKSLENTDKERHSEEDKHNKEGRNTKRTKNSVEKRKTQKKKRTQDEKVKCNACGIISDNNKMYQNHLNSQMHKAFSMIIDLT